MSGPTTAIFVADPITVLLSATAIKAALAVAAGYDSAETLRNEHQGDRDARLLELNTAASKGREALKSEKDTIEAEFQVLVSVAKNYTAESKITETRPAQPEQGSDIALAAYILSMQSLIKELRTILQTESALRLDNLAPQAYLDNALAQILTSDNKTPTERLLARLKHLGSLPENITSLAKEINDAPFLDNDRTTLLMTELRMRIQKHAEHAQKIAVQEATSVILQHTLNDLGYQVEEIASTLFVEGGVVHFRRQGWDNYMVRMRVDPKTATSNFNVIRAVDSSTNEQSVLDHIAEDRWCAEFPALLAALDVRGIHLNVTRRLDAGELPVQLVMKDKLPKFSNEDHISTTKHAIAREIK
jgi:hypothetical protein